LPKKLPKKLPQNCPKNCPKNCPTDFLSKLTWKRYHSNLGYIWNFKKLPKENSRPICNRFAPSGHPVTRGPRFMSLRFRLVF
jgi:hypothetical protein